MSQRSRQNEEDGTLDQQALLDQMRGGNTGVLGNRAEVAASRGQAAPGLEMSEGQQSAAGNGFVDPAAASGQEAAPAKNYGTRLMEGDAGKLADPSHALESPKYAFLQAVKDGQYGYDQLPQILSALQGDSRPEVASAYKGWSANGDKLSFSGDKSTLDPRWNGVTSVDTIGGFKSGNPEGFRWGAEDGSGGGQAPGAAQALSSLATPSAPGPASGGLNVPTDMDFFNKILAQLRGGGGGSEQLDTAALLQGMQ